MFLLFLFQEAERLEPTEDPAGYTYIDYSEKRSLPISVPDYHYSEKAGERYVVIRSIRFMHISSFKIAFAEFTHQQIHFFILKNTLKFTLKYR